MQDSFRLLWSVRVMRKTAQPSYNFFARIDPETDERRRRLQDQLDFSAAQLVAEAFRKLEASIDRDLARQSSPAA
jgi:hypothetical protein